MRFHSTILVTTLALVGCGGSGSGDMPDAAGTVNTAIRYEPWTVGSVWSYKLTDKVMPSMVALGRKTTIMGAVDVGGIHAGKMAFQVHVEQLVGAKDVYETFMGDLDVRYKTVFFDANGTALSTDVDQPYRLKLDESAARVAANAQFSETFTETTTPAGGQPAAPKTKTEQWHVIANAESLTVLAGTYTTLHVQRTSSTGTIQDYWYARGVGKVKETGGSYNEELMSYTPGP